MTWQAIHGIIRRGKRYLAGPTSDDELAGPVAARLGPAVEGGNAGALELRKVGDGFSAGAKGPI